MLTIQQLRGWLAHLNGLKHGNVVMAPLGNLREVVKAAIDQRLDAPATPAVPEPLDAIAQLRTHQKQLDPDGITVGVSREALEQVLAYVDQLRAK